MSARLTILSLILAAKSVAITAVNRSEFYPFGSTLSDSSLNRGDEAAAVISNLPSPFPFFGELHQDIHIMNDGVISFGTSLADTSRPQRFPTSGQFVAPFWADVDTTLRGWVWYRVTTDHETLQKVNKQLLAANMTICTLQYLVVVTWETVSYYRFHFNKTNTFQCVLATNGSKSIALFLYEGGGIQWTTGDASGGTFGVLTEPNGIAAVAGINGNETEYTLIPSSGTQSIINITSTSNVNASGVWVFPLDGGDSRSTVCPDEQSPGLALPVGTLIPIACLGAIVLLLTVGALYGYCQVGRLMLAQHSEEKLYEVDVFEREPLQEETHV